MTEIQKGSKVRITDEWENSQIAQSRGWPKRYYNIKGLKGEVFKIIAYEVSIKLDNNLQRKDLESDVKTNYIWIPYDLVELRGENQREFKPLISSGAYCNACGGFGKHRLMCPVEARREA